MKGQTIFGMLTKLFIASFISFSAAYMFVQQREFDDKVCFSQLLWNFTGNPSVLRCTLACKRDHLCSSFSYNDVSGMCRGYNGFLLNDTECMYELGVRYYWTDAVATQVYERSCSITTQCFQLRNAKCSNGKCQCQPGFTYSNNRCQKL